MRFWPETCSWHSGLFGSAQRTAPANFGKSGFALSVQEQSNIRYRYLEGRTEKPSFAAIKRFQDIALALLGLTLIAPLLLVIALTIILDSRGPLLFRQRRGGRGGKTFHIYKFRSMHVSEDGSVVIQAAKDDARVTRVGRFLRAFSLEELPQLFNVLKGDMSLVGPRPHATVHDEFYSSRIANYAIRQYVKPGITGWAQINDLRGPTPSIESMRARVEYDLWYVRHASLWLDIKILLRTPMKVSCRRNAH